MIHIDDLVRSRLQGGEEKERAGGWSSMRDLLEKEMPAAVAEGSGNRRLYGLLLLLLLGTSLTVGGYQWSLRNNGKSEPATGNSDGALASANNTKPASVLSAHRAETAAAINSLSKNEQPSANKNQSAGKKIVAENNIGNDVQAPVNISPAIITSTPESVVGNVVASTQKNVVGRSSEKPSLAQNNNADEAQKIVAAPANTKPQVLSSAAPAGNNNAPQNIAANQVVTPDGLHLLLRRDSIQRIDIAIHKMPVNIDALSLPATLHYDTISMQTVAVYQPIQPQVVAIKPAESRKHSVAQAQRGASATPVAVTNNNVALAAKAPGSAPGLASAAPFLQASSAAAAEAESSNLVSLSSYKVSSVKHNWWNPEKFSNMVDKTKFKLAGIQMFGGIEAGINGSFGNGTSLGGFECGITGLIALNEMLSINTGLYFYQRYNTGATVHDNYVAVDPNTVHYGPVPIGGVIYNHYQWEEDSVDHHFNYEKIQTLEIPLLLRYGAGRFFGEAGLNMMYAFKMKTSEITIHADHTTVQQASYPTSATPTFGTQPTVTPQDFNSRFGLGFAVGGGYHFSPAVTLDLHISKTVWDNAKTDGSRRISSDLYRIPSMQLSVGYRFSQQTASHPDADQ